MNKILTTIFDKGNPLILNLFLCREEVFQVEWDPNHETVLASSADDRRLMIWDLNRYWMPECILGAFVFKVIG